MPPVRPVMRVGLVLHPRLDCAPVVETVVAWARSRGTEVLVRPQDVGRAPAGVRAVSEAELAEAVGALISLGGDGTMLGALRLAARRPVPVLGVNLGHLGFLVEIEPGELDAALDRIAVGDFTIEEHSAVVLGGAEEEAIGFNDIALARIRADGAVHASLTLQGRGSGRYRCDALIVATPLGSTAYSYAAGGPLVSPALHALVVSVVAPITGLARSVVVSADEALRLTVLEDSGSPALEVDGTILRRAQPGEMLELSLRPRAGLVVRLDRERYQRRSQVKLSLLDLPFLPEELRGDPAWGVTVDGP